MSTDPLLERIERYRTQIRRADRLLASPNLPAENRANIIRVRNNFVALLKGAEESLSARDALGPGKSVREVKEEDNSKPRDAMGPPEDVPRTPENNSFSGWRRGLIFGVCAAALVFILNQRDVQRAYYTDAELYLGAVIFFPILAGLFASLGVVLVDFVKNPIEQRQVAKWLVGDPIKSPKESVRIFANLVFLGCIFLSVFGLDGLLESAFFWIAFVVSLVMFFVS